MVYSINYSPVTTAFNSGYNYCPKIQQQRDSHRIQKRQQCTILQSSALHTVQGVTCREVTNDLPKIGFVTVLEATADAQEELVNEVLTIDDEEDDDDDDDNHQKNSTTKTRRIKEGDPYGSVLWPASWAVANYVITTQHNLDSISVLELGTGTGLVSLALAQAGAKRVLATDYEPLALAMTEYAAKTFENVEIETQLFDLCDFKTPLPKDFDMVVAADIMYEPKTGSAMAHRVVEALQNNCTVIVGDSPGRAGRPMFLQTLKEFGIKEATFQDMVGRTCSGPRHDLICGKDSKSVSETPQELPVAIMHLEPSVLKTDN